MQTLRLMLIAGLYRSILPCSQAFEHRQTFFQRPAESQLLARSSGNWSLQRHYQKCLLGLWISLLMASQSRQRSSAKDLCRKYLDILKVCVCWRILETDSAYQKMQNSCQRVLLNFLQIVYRCGSTIFRCLGKGRNMKRLWPKPNFYWTKTQKIRSFSRFLRLSLCSRAIMTLPCKPLILFYRSSLKTLEHSHHVARP